MCMYICEKKSMFKKKEFRIAMITWAVLALVLLIVVVLLKSRNVFVYIPAVLHVLAPLVLWFLNDRDKK